MEEKQCRYVARILLKDWPYWQNCPESHEVRVARAYYDTVFGGGKVRRDYATVTQYRSDFLDHTLAWFKNAQSARMFCILHLGLPVVEAREKEHAAQRVASEAAFWEVEEERYKKNCEGEWRFS